MQYTVRQLAARGYTYYIEVEGGSWFGKKDAYSFAKRMYEWCISEGFDLEQAAAELGKTLYCYQ